MDLEQDYIEYVGQFSLALLAISAAYFFNPFRPISYLTLVLIPVLFGYTAYISREGFTQSSFLALIALIFVPLNYMLAVIAIVITLGNILVSLFAGGERFRDYYSSTTIPLLIVGLTIGVTAFYVSTSNPGVADEIRTSSGEVIGNSMETAIENAGLLEEQKQVQSQVVQETSSATVTTTRMYVANQTSDLPESQRQEIMSILDAAEQEVPEIVEREADERIEDAEVDISSTVAELVESNFRGKVMYALIPLAALTVYSLQPAIGLLTAVFASLFALAGRTGEEEE